MDDNFTSKTFDEIEVRRPKLVQSYLALLGENIPYMYTQSSDKEIAMTTANTSSRKKLAKQVRLSASAGCTVRGQSLTGRALLDDMEAYRKEVSATPEAAREFLTRLGVMTTSGKIKKLIRG